MDEKKSSIVNVNTELSDKELENVAAGNGENEIHRYTCVNPGCSMYLVYLPFQPPLGTCKECGQPVSVVF